MLLVEKVSLEPCNQSLLLWFPHNAVSAGLGICYLGRYLKKVEAQDIHFFFF